jgi:hypothetical protein
MYNSSEHETYDAGNRQVFMIGGNDKCVCITLRMRIVCMYGMCTSCLGAEALEELLYNEPDDMTTEYKQ